MSALSQPGFHWPRPRWLLLAACLATAAPHVCQAQQTVLFDFERPGLSRSWSAIHKITVVREAIPAPPAAANILPAGHGVRIDTPGQGGLFAKSGIIPKDWRRFEQISFWVYRTAGESRRRPTSVIEVRLYESDAKALFWQRMEIAHTGWQRYSLPLKWFRWGSGRVPRWDRVDRCGFWFRDAAELTMDAVTLTRGESDDSASISPADLSKLAFPDARLDDVTIVDRDDLLVLSDAPPLDRDQLTAHLDGLLRTVSSELPFLAPGDAPATLIVFNTKNDYRLFTPRLAARLKGRASFPTSDEFTTFGIASSYWEPSLGTLRPVYTHGVVHSLICRRGRFPNRGEWLQEGLAVHYQLKFHPQQVVAAIVSAGIRQADAHTPLLQLCNGEKISTDRYWQAMTVVRTLMSDEGYRQRLPDLFAAFADAGSTDLQPHLAPVLATSWDELTGRWRRYCEDNFAGPKVRQIPGP